VLAALETHPRAPGRRLKLVANLPYNVATPLVANLLMGPRVPCTMTVTVQKRSLIGWPRGPAP
jgi:16S rRNA (adenine1518-N6/adenine1519-N6)-dimethyltransferase